MEQIGEIAGFTLNYLYGYTKSRMQIAGGAFGPPTAADLVYNLSQDRAVVEARQVVSGFNNMILGEIYALAKNSRLATNDKSKLLTAYYNFLSGVATGSLTAADQIYIETYLQAWGLGYKEGFRDGYSMGYTAGFKDGYAAGYQQAWDEANKVINSLRAQIELLQQQLLNGTSAGGGGSFFDDIGTAVNIADTVIGIVSAFF